MGHNMDAHRRYRRLSPWSCITRAADGAFAVELTSETSRCYRREGKLTFLPIIYDLTFRFRDQDGDYIAFRNKYNIWVSAETVYFFPT